MTLEEEIKKLKLENEELRKHPMYILNTSEIDRLKKENIELRKCHDAELGVCFNHCDEVKELQSRITELEKRAGDIKKLKEIVHSMDTLKKFNSCEHCCEAISRSILEGKDAK